MRNPTKRRIFNVALSNSGRFEVSLRHNRSRNAHKRIKAAVKEGQMKLVMRCPGKAVYELTPAGRDWLANNTENVSC